MNEMPERNSSLRLVHLLMSKKKYSSLAELPDFQAPVVAPFVVHGGPFGLSWVFTFGEYAKAQATLGGVIDEDPRYVVWCLENVIGFFISDPAGEALAWALDE